MSRPLDEIILRVSSRIADEIAHEVENLYLCAVNEGDLYKGFLRMAGEMAPKEAWTECLSAYALILRRQSRAGPRVTSALVCTMSAERVKAYYEAEIEEDRQ